MQRLQVQAGDVRDHSGDLRVGSVLIRVMVMVMVMV